MVLTRPDGSTITQPAAPDAREEAAARAMAQQAVELAAAGQLAAAETKRQQLVAAHPGTAAAADIYLARAAQAESQGNIAESIVQLEHLLFYRPGHPDIRALRERYAELLLDGGRGDDAEKMLTSLFAQASTPADSQRLGGRLAAAAQAAGHGQVAVRVLMDLNQPTQAQAVVEGGIGVADAQALWDQHQDTPSWRPLVPLLGLRLAKVYYHVRDFSRAEVLLGNLVQRYGDSPYAAQAQDFLQLLRNRFRVDPKAVGVVLPLSGKYKQFGERSLQAIQLALGPRTGIKLAVKDTQGEPAIAAQAVESLVLENHVIAVLGPIFSTEALAAAVKAEELSVPLLSLSHREGLPEVGPNVFRTALTTAAQAKALVQVAFDVLHMRRFALLYPRNAYGLSFMSTFWDEVDKRQGDIVGAEIYEPDATTFREPVRRLVGRWQVSARPDYREAVDALKQQKLTPLRMRSEMDRLDKSLPPLVDFDALIIPDSGRTIGLLTPALAFEDIVLTHDPKVLDRIRRATGQHALRPITLMGASTWNSPQLLDSCETYCEDAVFVDAYFAGSPETHVRDFIGAFREATGGAEPYLSEAQAFDTAGLVHQALSTGHPSDRHSLRDQLLQLGTYRGVTGNLRFAGGGEVQRSLFTLTIKEHGIRQYEPTPEPTRG